MSFRFRRSISIFPGLRINLGKRGVSLSAGVRGAHVTVGKTGIRTTVGLPGTGLSYTHLDRLAKMPPAPPPSLLRQVVDPNPTVSVSNRGVNVAKVALLILVGSVILTAAIWSFANDNSSPLPVAVPQSAVIPPEEHTGQDAGPIPISSPAHSEPQPSTTEAKSVEKIVPSTPIPSVVVHSAAPTQEYYLRDYYSVEISDGIIAFKPGQLLRKVSPGKYMADAMLLTLPDSLVTTDPLVISYPQMKTVPVVQDQSGYYGSGSDYSGTPDSGNYSSAGYSGTPTSKSANRGSGPVFVNGYYRANGTYVHSYYRSR